MVRSEDTIALLERTPAVLDTLPRGPPVGWTMRDKGKKSWRAPDVVGNLIHCEQQGR